MVVGVGCSLESSVDSDGSSSIFGTPGASADDKSFKIFLKKKQTNKSK